MSRGELDMKFDKRDIMSRAMSCAKVDREKHGDMRACWTLRCFKKLLLGVLRVLYET